MVFAKPLHEDGKIPEIKRNCLITSKLRCEKLFLSLDDVVDH